MSLVKVICDQKLFNFSPMQPQAILHKILIVVESRISNGSRFYLCDIAGPVISEEYETVACNSAQLHATEF